MADKKISELDAITGANTAATDVFVVVDTSTGQTKKITREELNNAIEQDVLSSIDIDTINGDFSVNGNINLGDNNKAIFGAGSDLQIYHDGTYNFINAASGQFIFMQADELRLRSSTGETYFASTLNGATSLYHDASLKLTTTSTGIDVTGTVTSDGLTVQGDAYFDTNNAGRALHITRYGTVESESANFTIDDNDLVVESIQDEQYGGYVFKATHNGVGTRNRLDIANNGDISFYEDTGTTAKLFWDASAEALGIGTTSPAVALDVNGDIYARSGIVAADEFRSYTSALSTYGSNTSALHYFKGKVGIGTSSPSTNLHVSSSGDTIVRVTSADGNGAFLDLGDASDPDGGRIVYDSGSNLTFSTASTERMRIKSDGSVGIGVTSPSGTLHSAGNNSNQYIIGQNTLVSGGSSRLQLVNTSDTSGTAGTAQGFQIINNGNDGVVNILNYKNSPMAFWTNGIERMRIDSSGNVGIGTSSPSSKLHVSDANAAIVKASVDAGGTGVGSFRASHGTNEFGFYVAGTNALVFYDYGSNAERMRIDSSGNLLVGKTTNTLATAGIALRGDVDVIQATRSNGDALNVNRLASDGSLIGLYKDTVAVGNIGSLSGTHIVIDSAGNRSGLRFEDNGLLPRKNSAMADGTVTLGNSSYRFSDLHLSGTAYAGGLTVDTNTFHVDSSNNRVGIGTTSPDKKLVVSGLSGADIVINDSDATPNPILRFRESGSTSSTISTSSNNLIFSVTTTERMRITSGGRIGIGTSSPSGTLHLKTIRYDNYPIFQTTSDSFTPFFINFQKTDGTTIGSIRMTGTTGVAFNTTSDYRLKENVTGISDGIERVKQLNPSRFNFISDAGITVDGFLAHEAQTVVPQAVTGEKDAVDEDGNPEYQSIDHSKLVPLLTAALQEAIIKIENLEARVATLEGN